MARTNPKPLSIGVFGIDMNFPVIQKFQQKGHHVADIATSETPLSSYDVITGPICYRTDPRLKLGDDSTPEESLERQWEMLEASVRNTKFPKEKKDVT